jgi:hypothetical protein
VIATALDHNNVLRHYEKIGPGLNTFSSEPGDDRPPGIRRSRDVAAPPTSEAG